MPMTTDRRIVQQWILMLQTPGQVPRRSLLHKKMLTPKLGQRLVLLDQCREGKRGEHVAGKLRVLGLCLDPLQAERVQLFTSVRPSTWLAADGDGLTMAEVPSIQMRMAQVRKNHKKNPMTMAIGPYQASITSVGPNVICQRTTLSC
jgi:hypothetical protein